MNTILEKIVGNLYFKINCYKLAALTYAITRLYVYKEDRMLCYVADSVWFYNCIGNVHTDNFH